MKSVPSIQIDPVEKLGRIAQNANFEQSNAVLHTANAGRCR
jgi:hypothetical protein